MVKVTLPDNSSREYDDGATCLQVAESISAGLARVAIAAELDGVLVDLAAPIAPGEHTLSLLTSKNAGAAGLQILRHTAAHIMAQAVCRLYGPGVKYAIGPALVDDFQYGFYYDFDLSGCQAGHISADDLPKIEAEMKKIVAEKLPIERLAQPTDQAQQQMRELGQTYKDEMIADLLAGGDEPAPETISLYRQGEFLDMCLGPHLPNTGKLPKAYKLQAIAGAYWRGDEKNKMLTRIYGNAFFDKADLAEHLDKLAEARKRDHRVIGKQLGLFAIVNEVGPGLPLWMPKGAIIRMELEQWLRGELLKRGYQAVYTPHIAKVDLFRTSGHYPYYEHGLFPTMHVGEHPGDEKSREEYILKPMNCPFHINIYKAQPHSYRDLPVRLSEFGQVYRFEQSGELNGLTRVRGFCQDDAHIFCTVEQLEAEIESCVELTKHVLATLGLSDYRVRVSLRDPDSSKYVGEQANWDRAEENIRNVVKKVGLDFVEEPGEAAFYGPKIDFVVNDCIGRDWQLGTIQVDYNLPERFALEYTGVDNAAHRPVMIHRAPLGSPERFIGILIEHYAGAFPLWLSPVQVAVLPVSEKFTDYAAKVAGQLRDVNLRVELDDSPDKVGAKIRRATMDKIPYMLVIGHRELEAGNVSVRARTEGDLGEMSIDALRDGLIIEKETRGLSPLA